MDHYEDRGPLKDILKNITGYKNSQETFSPPAVILFVYICVSGSCFNKINWRKKREKIPPPLNGSILLDISKDYIETISFNIRNNILWVKMKKKKYCQGHLSSTPIHNIDLKNKVKKNTINSGQKEGEKEAKNRIKHICF